MIEPRSAEVSTSLPRRLAAVWFADIVGYTRLAAEDENAALAAVQRFQEIVREVVEARRGRLIKFIGDAALVEFPSAGAAVAAALAVTKAFGHGPESAGRSPVVARVGVHVGEVATTPDGDLLGDDVNLASRIHTAAEPGQVIVSEDVARQIRHLREVVFEPLGERELKGVPQLTRLFIARSAAGETAVRATAAPPRSIAVLPFANMSANPENEYFSDGVTEEILTALAQIEGLKVISRTSAMRYKETTLSLRRIGEELGVATVLEGSVRRAGGRVRITAQLIDARTDEHLWAERYDRDLEDIFAIQTDVAERIVKALKGRLTPGEQARLSAPTADVAAYQHFLRGLHFWNRRVGPVLVRAAEEFEAAIALDPAFAQAWALLAGVHGMTVSWVPAEAREGLNRATRAALRALAIDPDLGLAHTMLGHIDLREWRWAQAERRFRTAVELAPGDPTSRQWYAHYLASMGRFDEAYPHIQRALELDPLSLPVITEAGTIHLFARRYDQAERFYRQAVELDPGFIIASSSLADLYHLTGRHDLAVAQWRQLGLGVEESTPENPYPHLLGAVEAARSVGAPAAVVAGMFAEVGRTEEAFPYLELALETRGLGVTGLQVNPRFDALREDPRFQAILARVGLDQAPRPAGAV